MIYTSLHRVSNRITLTLMIYSPKEVNYLKDTLLSTMGPMGRKTRQKRPRGKDANSTSIRHLTTTPCSCVQNRLSQPYWLHHHHRYSQQFFVTGGIIKISILVLVVVVVSDRYFGVCEKETRISNNDSKYQLTLQ